MQKRGLSTVIVTLILILVSLVAVGIVWVVVRNVIQTGTEGVGLSQFSLNAKIMDVSINNNSNTVNLTVKRNAGQGDLTGINFIFSSDADTEVVTRNVSLKELEEKRFNFSLTKFNVLNLISISIIPLIKQDGKEIPGITLDKYALGKNQNTQSGQTTCTPAICGTPGYMCGLRNNGSCSGNLNCGSCGSQATCPSGTCICNSGWSDCNNDNACECDLSSNSCSGGSCVAQPSSSCGNNLVESGEACDGTNMSGYTCATVAAGLKSGTLSCSPDCKRYITTSCVAGNTINALSCSQINVQAAINSATDGDIVNVPAGNCIWNIVNCYPDANECSAIRINKSIFLKGVGIDNVIITNRIPKTWNNLGIYIQSQLGKPVRISGFTFVNEDYTYSALIGIGGTSRNSRIDHCKFQRGGNSIYFGGYTEGVVDHCEFINTDVGVRIAGDSSAAWSRPIVTGTSSAVFVEDNNFTLDVNFGSGQSDEMIYPQDGARPVVRYNTYNAITYTRDDTPMLCTTHGNWGNIAPYYSEYRGQPIYEIYNNKISIDKSYNYMIGGNFRGGSQLVYNNIIIKLSPGSTEYISGLTEEEGWTSGGTIGGTLPKTTTGPANDQVINSFFWNNTINGVQNNNVYLSFTSTNGYGYDDIIIQQNRDFYLHEPQLTGGKRYYVTNQECTGIGMPTSCCTGLSAGNCLAGHYDALATTASGANAYYPYIPYVYPHPLTLI